MNEEEAGWLQTSLFFFFQLINQINLALLEIEASVFLLIAMLHVSKDHWPAEGERHVMHFLSSPAIKRIFEVASCASGLSVLTGRERSLEHVEELIDDPFMLYL